MFQNSTVGLLRVLAASAAIFFCTNVFANEGGTSSGGDDTRPYNDLLCKVKPSADRQINFYLGSRSSATGFSGSKDLRFYKFLGDTSDGVCDETLLAKVDLDRVSASFVLSYEGRETRLDLRSQGVQQGAEFVFSGTMSSSSTCLGKFSQASVVCTIMDSL